MPIYHMQVGTIRRSKGATAVSAAAYRSGTALFDERRGAVQDFTWKRDVAHSEILTPTGAEALGRDREQLWNAVEKRATRRNACLAREVEFALPFELTLEQRINVARRYVLDEFVSRGMIADVNLHDRTEKGLSNHHAHVLLTTREIRSEWADKAEPEAFGLSVASWNPSPHGLHGWREVLAEHINLGLAEYGYERFVDHRRLKVQGSRLEPQNFAREGAASRHKEKTQDIAMRNGDRIIHDPTVALDAITRIQTTFTQNEMSQFLMRRCEDPEQRGLALRSIQSCRSLVPLGRAANGQERFTAASVVETEVQMLRSAEALALKGGDRSGSKASFASKATLLENGDGQQVNHAGVSIIIGQVGRTKLLRAICEIHLSRGDEINAVAPSRCMAAQLQKSSGIPSVSLFKLELQLHHQPRLDLGDVVIIEAAGVLGPHQLQFIFSIAERKASQVILLAASKDLEVGEVGGPLRALASRHEVLLLNERGELERPPFPRMPGEQSREARRSKAEMEIQQFAARRGFKGRAQERASLYSVSGSFRRNDADGEERLVLHERYLHRAIRRYAQVVLENVATADFSAKSHQSRIFERVMSRIEIISPGGAEALSSAVSSKPGLLAAAAEGRTSPLLNILLAESSVKDRDWAIGQRERRDGVTGLER